MKKLYQKSCDLDRNKKTLDFGIEIHENPLLGTPDPEIPVVSCPHTKLPVVSGARKYKYCDSCVPAFSHSEAAATLKPSLE